MENGAGSQGSWRQPGSDNAAARAKLVFFYSPTSGNCRRTDAFLAQALGRRRFRDAFELVRVNVEERADLADRFKVAVVPTLVIVEGRRAVRRIVSPGSAVELKSWLQDRPSQ